MTIRHCRTTLKSGMPAQVKWLAPAQMPSDRQGVGMKWTAAVLLVGLSIPATANERLVTGVVYSCLKEGIRHYMSNPPQDCVDRRTINYSYVERILRPGEQPIYSCIDSRGVKRYSGKAGPGCQYMTSHFEKATPAVPHRLAHQPSDSGSYSCTSDCSGHRAGYEWARNRGISDAYQCTGNSQSFIEGCRAFTEGHPGF